MVIKDLYSPEKVVNSNGTIHHLAPPTDRLLAGILDLLFHTPIFTLLSSMALYRLNVFKLTSSTMTERMAVLAQVVWIVVVGSVILQGIYLKLWRKTPGMKLLKLELKSLSGNELTWGQCLLRSTVWCFELALMGLPLLEIFSHPRRQAIHDRISETQIVTLKTWGALPPLAAEKSTVHLVFMCVLMVTLGWITALFSGAQKSLQEGAMALAEWREDNRLCSQVDEVATYSDAGMSDLRARIDFAISLFLLEQVDEDCFRKEVDLAVLKQVPGPLVWVGQALLSPLGSNERQSYFTKACGEESQWCNKALYQEKGSMTEARDVLRSHASTNIISESLALQTAKLILVNRLGAADQAANMIESIQDRGVRATGLVAEHLKAVSRMNPDRMPSVLSTLKSVMVEKDYMRLNADLCVHQLESGCGTKVNECTTLSNLLPKYKESLTDLVVSRALFKSAVCARDLASGMEYWTLISSEGLQKLVGFAIMLEKPATQGQGLAKVRSFIKDETQKLELRLDALQLLLSRSQLAADWKLASYLWSQFDWTQASFLSASEWLMREGGKQGRSDVVMSFADVFSAIPGLAIDWRLTLQKTKERMPANVEGKTK